METARRGDAQIRRNRPMNALLKASRAIDALSTVIG